MQKIMAINAGSSSLKFQIFEMPGEEVLVKGLIERIGLPGAIFNMSFQNEKIKEVCKINNHAEAVETLLEQLKIHQVINDLSEIAGVGHRVAHGGEDFVKSCVVTDEVVQGIEAVTSLAPLHNPANIIGIKTFRELLPEAISVAVFDTAFHQTIPEENFLYALPYELYEKHHIRKYGFHGTSHQYVAGKAAEVLGKPLEKLKIISCHLGNGASVCAIEDGKSVNTSMGFTPNAGLMMGTRSGTIDATIIPYLVDELGYSLDEVVQMMSSESGVLGVSGISSDFRDIEVAAEEGNTRAQLTLRMFTGQICNYIGAYASAMNGCDALLFTAGVGENSPLIRKMVTEQLSYLGVTCDVTKNNAGDMIISENDQAVKVCIIPTNEELMIARDVEKYAKQPTR